MAVQLTYAKTAMTRFKDDDDDSTKTVQFYNNENEVDPNLRPVSRFGSYELDGYLNDIKLESYADDKERNRKRRRDMRDIQQMLTRLKYELRKLMRAANRYQQRIEAGEWAAKDLEDLTHIFDRMNQVSASIETASMDLAKLSQS